MVIGPVEPNRPLPQQGGNVSRVSQSNKGAFSVSNPASPVPINPGQNAENPTKGGKKDTHKKSLDARLQPSTKKEAAPLPSEMEAARRKLFKELKEKEEEERKKKDQGEEENPSSME